MRRFFKGLASTCAAALIAAVCLACSPVYASPYGTGAYGDCGSGIGCSAASATPTITTTAQGLEIAINLADGQVIPLDVYTVRVTPLNGSGQSFTKAEFYVDGTLLYTTAPDSTGTASWQWDTRQFSGSVVKVIVHATDGTTIAKEFHVTIGQSPRNTAPNVNNANGNSATPSNLITAAVTYLENSVRALPTPVAVSIPYLLFGVLLVVVLLLLAQLWREAAEDKRTQQALQRARQLVDEKTQFAELTSHYLRTPLAIMSGAVDLLAASQPHADASLIIRFRTALTNLGATIEQLLSKNANNTTGQPAITPQAPAIKVITAPVFWVPAVVIAMLVITFDYFALRTGKIDFTWITIGMHIGVYVALVIALYMTRRWRQLQHYDHERTKQQTQQQAAIDEVRNSLIREGAATLQQKLQVVIPLISQLPEGKPKQLLYDGQLHMQDVLKRFQNTATVIPPLTTMPFQAFTLSRALDLAMRTAGVTAQARRVAIKIADPGISLASQQPAWISQILATLLDNAIAHSPDNSQVEVSAVVNKGRAVLVVKDYGSGIPQDKLPMLFQPFSKIEGAIQFDHPGLGLSLYLDRLLITSLGGDIQVKSQTQQGTKVLVSFPVK